MKRPKVYTRTLTVRLKSEAHHRMKKLAERRGVSLSELLRSVIRDRLQEVEARDRASRGGPESA